jgi:hypothetical protein
MGSSLAFPIYLDVLLAFGQNPRKILREMSIKTASLLAGLSVWVWTWETATGGVGPGWRRAPGVLPPS